MFWKPGTVQPGSLIDRDTSDGFYLSFNQNPHLKIEEQQRQLPIYKNKRELLYLVEKYPVTLVMGPSGSGKTTQVPQYLLESHQRIICTQPRRVQCTAVARRVSEETKTKLGELVGYSVRFDSNRSKDSRIVFVTDEQLFQEMLLDPLLSQYDVIMIDEAHERSIYTDILLGLLKKIFKKRPELRVIISSATLDADLFLSFFNTDKNAMAVALSMQSRMYPVDIYYTDSPVPNYIDASVDTVFKIHQLERAGDILVFMPGKEQVDQTTMIINAQGTVGRTTTIYAVPLYGGMSEQEQQKAFEPAIGGVRKVIVATHIAEASVTLNVSYVVDSGFQRVKVFNPSTGIERMIITSVSQASAIQRAGRAGRMRPGKAYRLYTEEQYQSLQVSSVPEIQRSNLALVILQLRAIGIDNVVNFDFVSPPPVPLFAKALELLYSLNAIDNNGKLTKPLGYNLAEFPVDPLLSTMLLNAVRFKCTEEALTVAAMLIVKDCLVFPKSKKVEAAEAHRQFAVEEGDHITYVNIYQAFHNSHRNERFCRTHFLDHTSLTRAHTVREFLKGYLAKVGVTQLESCRNDLDALRKCIVSGFFSHAAKLQPDGSYATVRENQIVHIHPASVLSKRSPGWVIFHEIIETSRPLIRDVLVIEPEWLVEIAPHFFAQK